VVILLTDFIWQFSLAIFLYSRGF